MDDVQRTGGTHEVGSAGGGLPRGRHAHIFSRRGVVRPPFSPALERYYHRRHTLFSKFAAGIIMDAEGWYSATPESVALRSAELLMPPPRLPSLFVDAFVGCGGNAIQAALHGALVIAIDIDPVKLACARHNAKIYGVAHRIEFVLGDFVALAPRLRAHVCFLSPPWGGPDYDQQLEAPDAEQHVTEEEQRAGSSSAPAASAAPTASTSGGGGSSTTSTSPPSFWLSAMTSPCCGLQLFDLARAVAPTVGYYLPATTDTAELQALARSHEPGRCELVYFLLAPSPPTEGDAPKPGKRARRRANQRKPKAMLACFYGGDDADVLVAPAANSRELPPSCAAPKCSVREETLYYHPPGQGQGGGVVTREAARGPSSVTSEPDPKEQLLRSADGPVVS